MGIYLRKGQLPILAANLVVISIFIFIFASRKNYEFLFYIGVIAFFLTVIVASNRKVAWSNDTLWGLTVWAALHLSGGGLYIGGTKLYDLILIPVSETYEILKYDQVVHAFGFGVATLVMYHLIRPHLRDGARAWTSLSIVVVMAGLGAGALNEIIEFGATLVVADTGVGGYVNTSLDLVSNLIGAISAMAFIRVKEGKGPARPGP